MVRDRKYESARLSLMLQFLLGLVTASSLLFDVPEEHSSLTAIVLLESISQAIEFVYYFVVVFCYNNLKTWTRYIDWVISTPVMLISTIAFFKYRTSRDMDFSDVFADPATYVVLAANTLMLCFGFLMERNAIDKTIGLVLGTAFFVASFGALFISAYTAKDTMSSTLFAFMFVIWGMYGVAATFSDVNKNISYNILDIFSKNFYGLFLFVYIMTLQN